MIKGSGSPLDLEEKFEILGIGVVLRAIIEKVYSHGTIVSTQSYFRADNALLRLDRRYSGGILPFYAPGDLSEFDLSPVTRYYGQITSFRCAVAVTHSLPAATMPEVDEFSSRTEKYKAGRAYTYASPRMDIELYMRKNGGDWIYLGGNPVIHHEDVPMYILSLLENLTDGLAWRVGHNSEIGIALADQGHGLLKGDDFLSFSADCFEEAAGVPRDLVISVADPHSWDLAPNTSQVIAPENGQRRELLLTNPGEHPVWVSRSPVAVIGSGLYLSGGGGSLLISHYFGAVSAICSSATRITGEVCA